MSTPLRSPRQTYKQRETPVQPRLKRSTRIRRALALRTFRLVRGGTIHLTDPLGSFEFGDGLGPSVSIEIVDFEAYDRLVRNCGIGLGTGYADGLWTTDDLTTLLRIALRNTRRMHRFSNRLHRAIAPLSDRVAARRKQDLEVDARDIRAHYDLGNDFFELVLDETMMYSCAYFPEFTVDLATASRAKLDLLNDLVDAQASDSILEIGTGWGGYALHTARTRGSKITTTTISREQFSFARHRMTQERVQDRVTVLDSDYRRLEGSFDKVVSIEMIEAVDWREYDTFFRVVSERLRPDGQLAMQAIVIGDADFNRTKNKKDFIKDQIFPGGCLPSVAALREAAANHGLYLADSSDLGMHYAETLRRWRENLHQAAVSHPEVTPLSDPRFVKLWDFYFAYCQAGFEEEYVSNKQLLFQKRDSTSR